MRQTILITGSTDGLGRRTAEKMAGPGKHLLIHGRSVVRGKATIATIESAGGTGQFLQADFASLAEVRSLADQVKAHHSQVDLLINNAGIAEVAGSRAVSHDGHERHFAVNYLAPFLLTHLLRPVLGNTRPSRIVNVTSVAQQRIDFENVMLEHHYSGGRAYGQSKLAQVMSTFDLANELEGSTVVAHCVHPGTYMNTGPVRAAGITPITSTSTGADAVIEIGTNPRYGRRTGCYFDGERESRANSQAYEVGSRRRLRSLTADLLGVTV